MKQCLWIVVAGLLQASAVAPVIASVATASPSASRPANPDMLVNAEWLAEHLNEPNLVVLHVGKNREEYDKAHIPGARFLAWSQIAKDREGVLNEIPQIGRAHV